MQPGAARVLAILRCGPIDLTRVTLSVFVYPR
jgi:hypothetical protein